MIDDDLLKEVIKRKHALDSLGLNEALRAAVEQQNKAPSIAGDLGMARDILGRQNLLNNYMEAGKLSDQILKATLDLGSAARTISGSIFGTAAVSAIAVVAKEQARWLEGISSAGTKMEEFARIHTDEISKITKAAGYVADWQRQITELSTVKGFAASSFQSRFGSISGIAEAAEASTRLVRWGNIAALDIALLLKNSLEFRTAQLNRSFDAFAGVMAAQPKFIVAAPPFVVKTSTLAVFSHAEALRSISVPADEEEEFPEERIWTEARDETYSVIEDLLPRISPELITPWKAGWDTADTQSKDWARQAAVSFRFVLCRVIDIAAPKDCVKADAKSTQKRRNFREQQISWLCNSLENEAYREMVLADIGSAVSIINLFSEAVHNYQHREIERAFPSVAVRASIALRHLLELHFNRLKQ